MVCLLKLSTGRSRINAQLSISLLNFMLNEKKIEGRKQFTLLASWFDSGSIVVMLATLVGRLLCSQDADSEEKHAF